MIEGDVEVLYEDEDTKILRIPWRFGDKHGANMITLVRRGDEWVNEKDIEG